MANTYDGYDGLEVGKYYITVPTSASIPREVASTGAIIPVEDNKVMISKHSMRKIGLDIDVNEIALEGLCQQFIRSLTHEARESREKN